MISATIMRETQTERLHNGDNITKSYILNIKIRPLVTEYALMIKLVDGTSSAHSFNSYAYFGHSWSYFDIQNLRLVIIYTNNTMIYITQILILSPELNEWAELVPSTSLIINAYSVTSGLILIFKMYDLVILFII
jgi:hypothetical protein